MIKIGFGDVDVYYFERAQGFSTIPTHGDIALGNLFRKNGIFLGMKEKHYQHKNFKISELTQNPFKVDVYFTLS